MEVLFTAVCKTWVLGRRIRSSLETGELKNPTGNPRGGVRLLLQARRPGIFRNTSQKRGVASPRVGNNYSLDAGEKWRFQEEDPSDGRIEKGGGKESYEMGYVCVLGYLKNTVQNPVLTSLVPSTYLVLQNPVAIVWKGHTETLCITH